MSGENKVLKVGIAFSIQHPKEKIIGIYSIELPQNSDVLSAHFSDKADILESVF